MSYKQKSEISHSLVRKWPSKNKKTRDASVGRSDYNRTAVKNVLAVNLSYSNIVYKRTAVKMNGFSKINVLPFKIQLIVKLVIFTNYMNFSDIIISDRGKRIYQQSQLLKKLKFLANAIPPSEFLAEEFTKGSI